MPPQLNTLDAPPEISVQPGQNAAPPIKHIASLDGLRGIAIALVLSYHGVCLLNAEVLYQTQRSSSWFWRMALTGWIGVDLFFVISGFLITSILLRTRHDARQLPIFWWRRALRIFPLAFLYLAVLVLFSVSGLHTLPLSAKEFAAYFLYFGNVHIALYGIQIPAIMILWSLAVEEQFYAVWPLIVRFITPRRVLAICAVLIVAAPVVRLLVNYTLGYQAAYVFTLCRADTLALGSGLAIVLQTTSRRGQLLLWARRLCPLALLVLLAIMLVGFEPLSPSMMPIWFTVIGFSVVASCFAIVVTAAVEPSPLTRRVLAFRPLRALGKICYGVYIWHCLVAAMLINTCFALGLPMDFWVLFPIWLTLTLVVASISWYFFESPVLELKKYFRHGSSRPARLELPAVSLSGSGLSAAD